MKNGTPQNVANTAWACATLGYEAPFLFDQLDRHLDRLLEKWNSQNIANTCYAIAILGLSKESEASLAKLWDRAIHLFVIGQEFVDKDVLSARADTDVCESERREFVRSSRDDDAKNRIGVSKIGRQFGVQVF